MLQIADTEQKEIICYKYLIRTSIHPVCWNKKTDGLFSMKILIKSKNSLHVNRESM